MRKKRSDHDDGHHGKSPEVCEDDPLPDGQMLSSQFAKGDLVKSRLAVEIERCPDLGVISTTEGIAALLPPYGAEENDTGQHRIARTALTLDTE